MRLLSLFMWHIADLLVTHVDKEYSYHILLEWHDHYSMGCYIIIMQDISAIALDRFYGFN